MENLRFRRELIRLGSSGREQAEQLWIMCVRDPLFYINTFCWTYDPRRQPSTIPFITYEYQDEVFREIFEALGVEDAAAEKSRDMGASWMFLTAFEHSWHFNPGKTFLLVSRVEDLVDKKNEPDSLMWKIDFLHRCQPAWLLPTGRTGKPGDSCRQKLSLYNEDNGSTITRTSTTSEASRGGRKTAILFDEFAAVADGHSMLKASRDATNCRFFNSTPQGTGNAFYDTMQTGIRKFRLHWSRHPIKAKGLYTGSRGEQRSPWYDLQCKRAAHPMEIAQELDIDYLGSDYQWFDPLELQRLQDKTVTPCYLRGELEYDPAECKPSRFAETPKGRCQLWVVPDANGSVPKDRGYAVGVDIATGTGASNSVISVADRTTGEKVAEFATPHLKPHDLAREAVAFCRWFAGNTHGAFLIWEANGPGRIFGDEILNLGYRNFFYRQNEKSLVRAPSTFPGWWASKETKLALLGAYRQALHDGTFINRSHQAVKECAQYVYSPGGGVAHSRSMTTVDPSGARENHADRVIADALAWKAVKATPKVQGDEPEVPVGSYAYRRNAYLHRKNVGALW